MIEQPVLDTPRLRLRPLKRADASAIQKAAGVREIADTMISLPHPYPIVEAERYVAQQRADQNAGRAVTFTIEQKVEGWFCGLVEVRDIDQEHSQGELSFWLAVDAWGQGYMSEVVQAVVQYGLEGLGLNRRVIEILPAGDVLHSVEDAANHVINPRPPPADGGENLVAALRRRLTLLGLQ